MVFSEAHCQGFSLGTPVSSPPSSVNGSANRIKLKDMQFKLCQIEWLSCPFVPCGTQCVASDRRSMCCM